MLFFRRLGQTAHVPRGLCISSCLVLRAPSRASYISRTPRNGCLRIGILAVNSIDMCVCPRTASVRQPLCHKPCGGRWTLTGLTVASALHVGTRTRNAGRIPPCGTCQRDRVVYFVEAEVVDHSCDFMMVDGLRSFSRRPATDVRHNALVELCNLRRSPGSLAGRSGSATQQPR